MLFPTLDFGLFFLFVFAAGWLMRNAPERRKLFLVLCSYFFYGYWDWRFVFLLFGSSLLSHLGALGIEGARTAQTRRRVLVATVALHLVVLGYFKYANFFLDQLGVLLDRIGFTRDLPVLEVLLPVGISFFTFNGISYVVDVYRRNIHAERSFVDILLYMSFFPHLVAGPILRATDFLPQLKTAPDAQRIQAGMGFLLILVGLFKKTIVANYLAVELVDVVFADPASYGTVDVMLATYGYAIQIYCDFSAYSDMATGVAALLGYRFPRNFDQPYRAESLRDFWRRWHMSLSTWLRDYLYVPLGGNRGSAWTTTRNLMLTMVLGGIWHGAAWTFVIWGTIHGLGLTVERAWSRRFGEGGTHTAARHDMQRPRSWLLRAFSVLVVFHIVCAAWVFFRAGTVDNALAVFTALAMWQEPVHLITPFLALLVGGSFIAQFLPGNWLLAIEHQFADLSPAERGLFVGLSIVAINALAMEGVAPFIYFQF